MSSVGVLRFSPPQKIEKSRLVKPKLFKKQEKMNNRQKSFKLKVWDTIVAGMKSKWVWAILCLEVAFIICAVIALRYLPVKEEEGIPSKSFVDRFIEWYNDI